MPFPKTLDALREAGYLPDGFSTCSCGAKIKWFITPKGKRMPVDVFESGAVDSHFATCPNAEQFRKKKA